MWETLKKQLIEKFINEVKSKQTWETLKQYINDDTIDKFIITPILSKINNHLNKYLMLFIAVNVIIMILILTNIFITVYYKK
jgi:nitrate/nitrite-specific signal transduction histidine kinase